MANFYRALAFSLLGLYAAAGFMGWEFAAPKRTELPASVRQAPGGYRSAHFWHAGFRGGK